MRFLNEQGALLDRPPKAEKNKASKLWMLGLEWQTVDKSSWGAVAREVASFKTLGGAIAIKTGSSGKGPQQLGLWALSFAEEEQLKLKLPKACYSLAAVFALAAQSQQQNNAVLYLDLGPVNGVNQAYFCRLFNGVPMIDAVFTKAKATELAQEASAGADAVFSNDQDLLMGSTPINLAWFAGATDQRALLQRVPTNLPLILAAVAVVVIVAIAVVLYQQYQVQQRKAEAARLAAENDPLPKYQAALAQQRLRLGMDSTGTAKLFDQLMKTPRAQSGWKLAQLDCNLAGCMASWTRAQGTFADVKKDRANDKLLVPASNAQGKPATTPLDTLTTRLSLTPDVADLPKELPKYDDFVFSASNTLQRWANAGIAVTPISPAATWPNPPELGDVRPPVMVGKIDFKLVGVNAVFGRQLISQLPPSTRISKLVLHSGADSLTLDLTGDSYVLK